MRRIFATCAATMASCLLTTPAFADQPTYLSESLLGLQSSHVYVSPQVRSIDSATVEQLETSGEADDIAFVVLPSAAASEASASQMVSDIARGTTYDTVVVVIGSDIEAGSRVLPAGEANTIANTAEANTPSLTEALLGIANEVQTSSGNGSGEPAPAGGSDDAALPASLFLIPALMVAGLAGAFWYLRNRSRQRSNSPDETPEELKSLIGQIRSRLGVIARQDASFAGSVDESLVKTGRLFWRLKNANNTSFHQITSTYASNLESVLKGIETYSDAILYPGDYRAGEPRQYAQQIFVAYQEILDHNMLEATRGQLTQTKIASRLIETNVPIKFQDPLKEKEIGNG
jgi:hypothetical protein